MPPLTSNEGCHTLVWQQRKGLRQAFGNVLGQLVTYHLKAGKSLAYA